MFDDFAQNDAELRPWIVVGPKSEGNQESVVATWQLRDNDASAVAIFSTQDKAAAYAADCGSDASNPPNSRQAVRQLDHVGLIRLFASCYRDAIRFAALDPTRSEVRQVFKLADVLKSARDSLAQQKSLEQ